MKTTALVATMACLLLLALGLANTVWTSLLAESNAVPHSRIHR
jgi:hypothetical protein